MLCVVGHYCSHGSSNPFSIGKYPFFIYKIEHKISPEKSKKALKIKAFLWRYLFYRRFLAAPVRSVRSRFILRRNSEAGVIRHIHQTNLPSVTDDTRFDYKSFVSGRLTGQAKTRRHFVYGFVELVIRLELTTC